MTFAPFLEKVEQGQDLSAAEARAAFDFIFEGGVSNEDLSAFLLALCQKGEAVDELKGAVASMKSRMIPIKAPPDAMDIVGTGGDLRYTLNISTAVAFVIAACGVPVAKHGNRAATSMSGSSDMLAALGIHVQPDLGLVDRCLTEANMCFLYAPRHHPAMKHVAEVRRKLGVRTIFNLLGPLTNPANVRRHLIGVFEREYLGPMAEVLKENDSEAAWFACGQDGMDEITTTAASDIVELRHGNVRHFTIKPEQFGIRRAHPDDLKGGDAMDNAAALRKLLDGQDGPYRDIVLMNAGAALVVADKATDIRQGIPIAADAIDNGGGRRVLDTLVRLTNETGI